jgi:hypothetical protein
MIVRKSFVLFFILFMMPGMATAEGGKLESIGAFAGATASESLKKSLEERGYRVTLTSGTVICELWMRKTIPTEAKKEVPGSTYSEIVDSAIIGVVSFPKTAQDFRGQDIKPGAYTLRYGDLAVQRFPLAHAGCRRPEY